MYELLLTYYVHISISPPAGVGLANLPLQPEVIDSLRTEAHLRAVFNVPAGPLPAAIVQSQLDNRRAAANATANSTSSLAVVPAGETAVAASDTALTTSTNTSTGATSTSGLDLETQANQDWVNSFLTGDGQGGDHKLPALPDNAVNDGTDFTSILGVTDDGPETPTRVVAQSLVNLSQAEAPMMASVQEEVNVPIPPRLAIAQGTNNEGNEDETDMAYIPTSSDADVCSNTRLMWLNTLFNSAKVTVQQDLIDAPIRSTFAVVEWDDNSKAWRRVIIRKKRKYTWTIIDEFGDTEIYNITATEDDGPIAMWGKLYTHPSKRHFDDAKEAANKRKELHDVAEEELNVSPRRKKIRDDALEKVMNQGRSMKLRAKKVAGEVNDGDIVQIPLSDVDCTKVDGKVLTLVVVETIRYKGDATAKYRLACAKGPLQRLYDRSSINLVPQGSRLTLGLDHVYTSWRGMTKITERAAAASTSMVGGQGKKDKCGCKKGKCSTNQCACFQAKRNCGSHCHGGLNSNCNNCDPARWANKFLS